MANKKIYIDDHVRQVKLAEALVVLIQVGTGVTLVVVAVEHAAGNGLAIAADGQAVLDFAVGLLGSRLLFAIGLLLFQQVVGIHASGSHREAHE